MFSLVNTPKSPEIPKGKTEAVISKDRQCNGQQKIDEKTNNGRHYDTQTIID